MNTYKSGLILILIILMSCESDLKDVESLNSTNSAKFWEIYKIQGNERDELNLETKEELLLYLDSTELIGINDDGYNAFIKIFTCQEADSIARDIRNAKLSLYAFYFLFYEECEITLEESLNFVEIFKKSDDTIYAWLTSGTIGYTTLKDEAADATLETKRFNLTSKQEEYLLKVLGYPPASQDF